MECSGAHVFDDVLHGFPQAGVGLDALAHDLEGVDDGGMVPAAHLFADVLHAHAGDLPDDIDGGAAGRRHGGVALGAADVRSRDGIGAGHLADDLLHGDGHGLGLAENVPDGVLGHPDHRADALQHVVGVQLFDRALQLADVVF